MLSLGVLVILNMVSAMPFIVLTDTKPFCRVVDMKPEYLAVVAVSNFSASSLITLLLFIEVVTARLIMAISMIRVTMAEIFTPILRLKRKFIDQTFAANNGFFQNKSGHYMPKRRDTAGVYTGHIAIVGK